MLTLDFERQLKDFRLRVRLEVGNDVVALFGPSGAGKTQTLNCIAGLVRPDAGRIVLDGTPVFDAALRVDVPPQRRRVGYVFQHYALLPHLTVAENVGYGLHRRAREARQARVTEMLRVMGLEGLAERRPGELSGGQQQRVAVARALAIEPAVLLMDEPFAALDSGLRRRLQEELVTLLRSLPITTVLVTHSLREAYILAQQVAIYEAGQVLQVGAPEEVVNRPGSAAVARLMGIDNIFAGAVAAVQDDGLEVRCGPLALSAPAAPFSTGAAVDVCIPSRAVSLLAPVPAGPPVLGENQVLGRLVKRIPHLASTVLIFTLEGWDGARSPELHVELPSYEAEGVDPATSDRWVIALRKDALHVMARST